MAMKKQPPPGTEEKIAKMNFAKMYPILLQKVEKKGRTQEELNQVIQWLFGYSDKKIAKMIKDEISYGDFINKAKLNSHAHLITGVICGYRVEDLENPFIQKVRYLDKLIDELAKGKAMVKILRDGH